MSIPKEPRQLMINLMYLVLTALLALNVSAEIVNAFFAMDESIQDSTSIVGGTNTKLLAALGSQAEAYTQYEPLYEKALAAQKVTQTFYKEVDDLRNELIEKSGGMDDKNLPKGKLDKDITTRFFVKEGRGDELETSILDTRDQLLELIEDEAERAQLASKIPLQIQEIPENSDKKTWAQFTFQQMPVAAILPMFSKLQNDVKIAETAVLNYLIDKTNTTVKPDTYIPIVSADKSYVIKGDDYRAELFLGAYSSTADNMDIKVNGRKLRVRDGKAVFNSKTKGYGKKSNNLEITMTDPITGERKLFKKKFEYEVGARSITVSADKMNVMYMGVENPISISVAGASSGSIKVSGKNVEMKGHRGKYIATPTSVGDAKIIVSGEGFAASEHHFRVKRIPDPVMRLGKQTGGRIGKGTFKAQQGILAILENFDFEARCKVLGFELTRQPKNADVIYETNRGGKYNSASQRLIKQAKSGDTYYYDKIRVKCPGDEASRKMDGMIFKIK